MSELVTLTKFLTVFSALVVIGALLAMAFLLVENNGKLQSSAQRIRKRASLFASVWLGASIAHIIATLANILGSSFSDALDQNSLQSFLTQVDLGQYLAVQTLAIAILGVFLRFIRTAIAAMATLFAALAILTIPVFQSHSASSGSHQLAIGSLVVHVVAISLWVGGVFAIVTLPDADRKFALPRFSQLALWAAIAVALSGALNAWTRLNFSEAWSSAYARIVLIKVALTFGLLLLGILNRRTLQRGQTQGAQMLGRFIVVEAAIMVALLVLGSLLSQSEPPTRGELAISPALSIVGFATPEAPSLTRVLFAYQPDALVIGILITLVALYIKGVVVLTKRGDKWPVGRTISFALGISALDFATSGGLGVYALFSFEYHMIAHMVIGMIAPIAIVLSAPITLALRTLPQGRIPEERGVRGALIALLHSRYSVILTNPITALALFDGSLFVLYFTDLFGNLMQSHVGHLLMNAHFFLAGFLFFHVIIGIDPNPKKIPYIVRIVILFAAMSIHAFFSIALISSSTLVDGGYYASLQTPWLGDLLADQNAGGSIGWAMGEIPIILALIATFIQWMRDDKRETKRIDRNEARMAAMGEPDELAQYNNYLSQLQKRDENGGR
jgi:putative copper resistance protein D